MKRYSKIFLLLTCFVLSLFVAVPAFAAEGELPAVNVLTTLAIDSPAEITVNQRIPVTIVLKDQNGNDFVTDNDITIGLSSRNGEGAFYAKPVADTLNWWGDYEQYTTSSITVSKSAYKATVWYQPYSNVPNDNKNILNFGFEDGNGINQVVQKEIGTIRPAGASYIAADTDKESEFVSDTSSPKPIKVTFTLKDQYDNDQSLPGQYTFPLYTQEDVKLFTDAECQDPASGLEFEANAVSSTVYAISQRSGGFSIWTETPGLNYEPGVFGLYFQPEKVVKVQLLSPYGDATRVGNYLPIKILATDKFDNETYYFDDNLTALLSSNIGHFYNDYGDIITQASAETPDDFNGGWWWWDNVYFKSDEAGTATLGAEISGLEVVPLTISVQEPQIKFYLYAFSEDSYGDDYDELTLNVRPEWRVPLYPYFENQFGDYEDLDYGKLSVTYQAYIIQDGIEKPVGAFYDGYNSGEEINETNWNAYYYEYEPIFYEVPADLPVGTPIYIKATPESYSDQAKVITLIVKTVPDFTSNIDRGWNIVSTPFALTNNNLLNIIDKPDYVQVAYGFKDGKWYQMKASDPSTMKVDPLEAYYVKVKGQTNTSYFSLTTPTAPPTKTLAKGWNLVSAAIDTNTNYGMNAADAFHTVIDSSSILLSPALNQPAWSVVNWGGDPWIYSTAGYWLYMDKTDELSGFSTTPVTNPRAYYRDWGEE